MAVHRHRRRRNRLRHTPCPRRTYTLARVDERITAVRAADAQRAHRLPPPEPPRWCTASAPADGPTASTPGACKVTSRGRAATRDTVLEVLRTVPSAIACPLCRPDSELGLLDS
ncbi:hypothetical protein [Streptomyces sp. LN699]|uniref:hypothetical protein n=1 Tax=Streptomyces sp. LN699 TaxID=3112981 RepID=UPI00372277E7